MAKTGKERLKEYRERLYSAGYKQVIIWVPKDSEGKAVKMERKMFLKRIESLTIGWSRAKLNRLFKDVIKHISEKIKKEGI